MTETLTCRDIAARVLGEPRRIAGHEALWLCPNHDDHNPSLQINFSKDKWMCGPCGKGGGPWTLAAFLGHFHSNERKEIGHWLREKMGEFELPTNGRPADLTYKPTATYYYTQNMRVIRLQAENPYGGKPYKKYCWEHYDINTESWLIGGARAPKPLYVNTVFKEAEQLSTVYGFEGENKCEAAGEIGLPSFSYKHFNDARETEKLAGLEVILWPDYDDIGFQQCKKIAEILFQSKHPRAIRVIRPPMDLPVGGDIIDALKDYGYDKEKILKVARAATSYPPPEKTIGQRLSKVQPKTPEWIWLNRIPSASLTMLDGDPETNKSTLALEIAARITKGEALPDNGIVYPPANVVVCSAEDSLEGTIVPRLIAAGADRTRIIALPYTGTDPKEYFQRLPAQTDVLKHAIEQEQARLCIFDVLASYIPVGLSMSNDQDVRAALSPLAEIGSQTGCAFIALRHLNKAQSQSIMYRGGGSIGIVGAARAALFLAKKPGSKNERVLTVYKNNVGEKGQSWEFTVTPGEAGAVHIVWGEASNETPESLLSAMQMSEDERTVKDAACKFLQGFVSDGPMPVNDCLKAGLQNGFNKKQIVSAKIKLQLDSLRLSNGGDYYWRNPSKPERSFGN